MMHQDNPQASYRMTPPAPVALESIRITLDLYRSGKSGVQFVKLQKFSQPILTHYQLELSVGFDDEVSVGNLQDMTLLLDILETATIFWEYCSLNDTTKSLAFNNLQESLIGPQPSSEDLVQFPVLVASMEKAWEQLSDGEPVSDLYIATDNQPDQKQAQSISGRDTTHYGSEKLDTPEAFALFARPILDNEALYEDPEFLDDAMSRAQAYWDLAHVSLANLEKHIDALTSQFCSADLSRAQLEEEAHQMIQRFHELFPERKS